MNFMTVRTVSKQGKCGLKAVRLESLLCADGGAAGITCGHTQLCGWPLNMGPQGACPLTCYGRITLLYTVPASLQPLSLPNGYWLGTGLAMFSSEQHHPSTATSC
jgi:hypothetical protein